LPGHQFTWEEESYCDETDIKDKNASDNESEDQVTAL